MFYFRNLFARLGCKRPLAQSHSVINKLAPGPCPKRPDTSLQDPSPAYGNPRIEQQQKHTPHNSCTYLGRYRQRKRNSRWHKVVACSAVTRSSLKGSVLVMVSSARGPSKGLHSVSANKWPRFLLFVRICVSLPGSFVTYVAGPKEKMCNR